MGYRTIPWLWLALGFLWCTTSGFFLAYTPLWVKAWAIAEPRAWIIALTGFTAFMWTGVLPIVWTFALTGSGAMPTLKTIVVVGVVVIAGFAVMVVSGIYAWVIAFAWSCAWAWVASMSEAWTLTRILARTVVVAIASSSVCGVLLGILSLAMPRVKIWVEISVWLVGEVWAVTLPIGVVGVLALIWAQVEDELPKTISQFHTFVILALTSLSGIGLGWLANLLCR